MARCWSAVSATLLMAGCYTGVDGLDRGDDPDALPPGAADDAGEDAGDDDGEPDEPDVPCRTAGRTATRLLTAVEYENSVRRLLGVDTEVRSRLPVDETVSDLFVHNATAELDESKARKYMLIAEQLVDEITVPDLLSCDPGDTPDAQRACAEQFVRELGRRTYRRPLSEVEVARWLGVYEIAREDEAIGDGFNGAVKTVISGMLQAPGFLMVTEVGEVRDDTPAGLRSLTAHELAAKLAFLVWDDLPDDELAAVADDGTLVDPDVLEAQARRMLEDPRAHAAIGAFFEQWLHIDHVKRVDNVDDSLQDAMVRETSLFVNHVVWSDDAQGTLDELLTADYTFANAELAKQYGLPGEELTDEHVRVSLPPERVGVLGHGSLLAAHGARSISIHRGLHVFRSMMCRSTPPPDPTLDTAMFDGLTPREAAEARIDTTSCTGCHGQFETVGLAFEHFDATGQWRDVYEDESPVDAHGSWTDPNAQQFDGVAELAAAMADSEEVERCAAQRVAEFAFGADVQSTTEDRSCMDDPIAEAFVESGGDLRELLVSLVRSDGFRLRDPGEEMPTCE